MNLSHTLLTQEEIGLLTKGLKFIPVPAASPDLSQSLSQYVRRCALAVHFKDRPPGQAKPFTESTGWQPPVELPCLLGLQADLKERLGRVPLTNASNNLPPALRMALKHLKTQNSAILKPADKGSCLVVMDCQAYAQEALRQLQNPLHYRALTEPVYPRIRGRVNKLLSLLTRAEVIDGRQLHYLKVPAECRPRRLYLLPKIHKSADTWPQRGRMPPGRPIVSDCGSDTYHVSQLLAALLHPLATSHPSYVKDTPDFIDKITALPVPHQALLVTMDVSSLYTNIDPAMGLPAVRKALEQSGRHSARVTDAILELLELILSHNDFQFAGKWFLQILGTAMGKPFAPEYANIAMWAWETLALSLATLQPALYLRYLDDIFLVWNHSRAELGDFFNTLNGVSPTIQLTMEVSSSSVDFLDTTVFKGPRFVSTGRLDTKVYFKPTHTHELLHRTSFHPQHTFPGLVKSQVIRFKRICTHEHHVGQATGRLFAVLRRRNYTRALLRKVLHRNQIQPAPRGKPCGQPDCALCPRYWDPQPPVLPHLPGSHLLTCTSSSLVYLLRCGHCHKRYVGQTARNLVTRALEHVADTHGQATLPASRHFRNCGQPPSLWVSPLQQFPISALRDIPQTPTLLAAESRYMDLLDSRFPQGLNTGPPKAPLIPFILTFGEHLPDTSLLIKRAHVQHLTADLPTLFPSPPLMAIKRNPNLSDDLVRAAFLGVQPPPPD